MLAGGEARGSFDIVGQARHAENHGVHGLLGAKSCASGNTTLAEGACQAQDASQGADAIMLLGGKL